MKVEKKGGKIIDFNEIDMALYIKEAASEMKIFLTPTQEKNIASYIVKRGDEHKTPVTTQDLQKMVGICVKKALKRKKAQLHSNAETLSKASMEKAKRYSEIYSDIYLRHGAERCAARIEEDWTYKILDNAETFVAQSLAFICIDAAEGKIDENEKNKRTNDFLSIITIIDDETEEKKKAA